MTKMSKKAVIAAFAMALGLSLGCDDDSGGSSGAGGAGAEGGAGGAGGAGAEGGAGGTGGQAQACTPEECGPAPGVPNELCPDGENYSGFGPCARAEDGTCGYPRLECPGGAGGEGGAGAEGGAGGEGGAGAEGGAGGAGAAGGAGGTGGVDPTVQAVCDQLTRTAEAIGCAARSEDDCQRGADRALSDFIRENCLQQYLDALDCAEANVEGCSCSEDDNRLDCRVLVDIGGPCVDAQVALEDCLGFNTDN